MDLHHAAGARLNGSVRGKNSDTGYWEVEYKGRLGYITGRFGKRV